MTETPQKVCELIPDEEMERVLNQEFCDIDPTFMGFMDVYENLSKIIPKHFTVVDLGCAYNPQCYYFKDHLQFIAVDADVNTERFKTENSLYFGGGIELFINDIMPTLKLNLEETFSICSYVPPWYGFKYEMVNNAFKNLFVYYPHGGYKNQKTPKK